MWWINTVRSSINDEGVFCLEKIFLLRFKTSWSKRLRLLYWIFFKGKSLSLFPVELKSTGITLSMMPSNRRSSSRTFPEGQDDLLLFWLKFVNCFLSGSLPALGTWRSRLDSNAELGIRNHQRSTSFQRLLVWVSFLRLSLPITHNIDPSCNFHKVMFY